MAEIVHKLNIAGMTCGCCTGKVMRVLGSTPGILGADISHENNNGVIITDKTISTDALVYLVNSAGFSASY